VSAARNARGFGYDETQFRALSMPGRKLDAPSTRSCGHRGRPALGATTEGRGRRFFFFEMARRARFGMCVGPAQPRRRARRTDGAPGAVQDIKLEPWVVRVGGEEGARRRSGTSIGVGEGPERAPGDRLPRPPARRRAAAAPHSPVFTCSDAPITHPRRRSPTPTQPRCAPSSSPPSWPAALPVICARDEGEGRKECGRIETKKALLVGARQHARLEEDVLRPPPRPATQCNRFLRSILPSTMADTTPYLG
jgi:hypothetical protein